MNAWFYAALLAFVLLLLTWAWVLIRVLRPLRKLVAQTTEVAQGNLTAFNQPCGGIAELETLRHTMASMAGHVRRTHADETAYRYALTDGQEAERARIAHELHDETVQALVAIAQSINLASSWIEQDQERATTMLKQARSQTVETVEAVRRLIADLRPPALAELGLIPALRMLVDKEPGIEFAVQVHGKERRLEDGYELTLFRAAQEAVRNARRHGQAKNITITADYQPDTIQLTVQDDGAGFDVPDCVDCMAKAGHFGLVGIHERVQHLNGTVDITSRAAQGTTLKVMLPLTAVNQPTETVRDPVCGALIAPQQAYGSVSYNDQRYYFCCPVCQGAFQRDPETILAAMM